MILFSIFSPLFSFFLFIIFSKILKKELLYFSCFLIVLSTIFSYINLTDLINNPNNYEIFLFKWLHSGSLISNWTVNIDFLTSIMIFVVLLVSSLVQIYSIDYMKHDLNISRFFCYLNLFSFFMLLLVTSGNLLQLFIGWEGVGLCSYLLIGFWFYKKSASDASLKAFIVNRIADMFFVLGIIFIYIVFDSISFNEIFSQINKIQIIEYNFLFFNLDQISIICILLLIGAMGKSAQIGFHTWLPDAMEGPTPVSALIHAATMVTAGVFLICKFSIFFNNSVIASNLLILVGSVTTIFTALISLTQNDIKKIIAYSTCSQLGFMFIAAGFSMYNLAIFHLTTHAFFKALLFLGAGSVIHSTNEEQNIKKMGALYKKLPITYIIMVIGSLALSGIPFFSGYYSKELIINSGLSSSLFVAKYIYITLILGVLLTSMYSFRLIFYVFHGKINFPIIKYNKITESSLIILIPLIILSIFAIFSGYFFKDFFINDKYNSLWTSSNIAHIFNLEQYHQLHKYHIIPTIFAFLGIFLVLYLYILNINFIPLIKEKYNKLYDIIYNKFYFDEFYNKFFVDNLHKFSENLWKKIDIDLIDRVGPNGLASLVKKISKFFSSLQTGYIYHYAFSFIIGLALLITFIIFF
tara:strand:+ start:5922 stop:7832 length:1911 start_codon:yes stop_codon:yes gene_type:complete